MVNFWNNESEAGQAGPLPRETAVAEGGSVAGFVGEPTGYWPHLTALLDVGGHVTLGRVEPLDGVAIAANEAEVFAVLKRRPDESPARLLERLEEALQQQAHGAERVNEIGTAMMLERASVRKRRAR